MASYAAAYLRKISGRKLAALEQACCERIVVDNGSPAGGDGMLATVLDRLADGDTLVVWSLDQAADSLRELIDLVLDLDSRNVRFRSIHEGFDTHGRQRATIRTTLVQLQEFKRQVSLRRANEAALAKSDRRVGRPRALTERDVEQAKALVKNGAALEEVARKFKVSRATIYRYLLQGNA